MYTNNEHNSSYEDSPRKEHKIKPQKISVRHQDKRKKIVIDQLRSKEDLEDN